eukprot:11070406-Alexandrium_andersonii.AAC.1
MVDSKAFLVAERVGWSPLPGTLSVTAGPGRCTRRCCAAGVGWRKGRGGRGPRQGDARVGNR